MKITDFISHRGANQIAPENTMVAFKKSYDGGCQMMELDVQLSKDDVLFIFHDNNAKRLTGLNVDLTNLTYAEIRKLTVLGKKYPDEAKQHVSYIPTMKEYLDWMRKVPQLQTNIEIKVRKPFNKFYESRLVVMLLKLLQEYPDLHQKLLLSSFSEYAISLLAHSDLKITRELLILIRNWEASKDDIFNRIKQKYDEWGCSALGINSSVLTSARIKKLKDCFGLLFVYSLGKLRDNEILKLLADGADSVFIDALTPINHHRHIRAAM